jgi:hypothetical protein
MKNVKFTTGCKMFMFTIFVLFCLSIFALVNIDNLNFKSSKYSSSTTSSKNKNKNKKNVNASDFYKFYKILHKNKNHVPFSYDVVKFYIPYDLRLD